MIEPIRHKVRFFFFFAIFLIIYCISLTGLTQNAHANSKYASIVMDADTGMILHKRYADRRLHPASLTKMMTLLLVFDAMEAGKISRKTRIKISKTATEVVPSKLNLPIESRIRIEDAIYALITKSANDVAVALAEHLAGSEASFARVMTQRARDLGMSRTVFRNASGLHHPAQISTARDMAKLARTIITQYPQHYRYFSTKKFYYRGKTYRTHNRLMETYKGMDGMKTGYIRKSGFNLVASAVRHDKRLIGVVFGGEKARSRNAHMKVLLDRAFSKVEDMRIASLRPPKPKKKPNFLVALASVNDFTLDALNPAAGTDTFPEEDSKWALLNPALEDNMFSRMIGEGDFDPAASRRFETGLLAIAALKGEKPHHIRALQRNTAFKAPRPDPWSIQVGVFASRAKTDKAILIAKNTLPQPLKFASPIIVPLRTTGKLLFRARLTGYTQKQARAACLHFADCMTVPPASY